MISKKILAMHQPNFFPWIGFFAKVARADKFAILDRVQYPRGSTVANRASLKGAHGPFDFILPLSRSKGLERKESYDNVKLAESKWRKKFFRALQVNYSRAPYYEDLLPVVAQITDTENFCALNVRFIQFVKEYLKLNTEFILLSETECERMSKNQLIACLCKNSGTFVYLSGRGAQKYNEPAFLAREGIELKYLNWNPKSYPQQFGRFQENLSMLDVLFNCGPESSKYL